MLLPLLIAFSAWVVHGRDTIIGLFRSIFDGPKLIAGPHDTLAKIAGNSNTVIVNGSSVLLPSHAFAGIIIFTSLKGV
jgi:hypothetical protein